MSSPPERWGCRSTSSVFSTPCRTASCSQRKRGGVFLALLARPLRPAFAGITAGWARWLELRLDGRAQRVAAWIWPVAFLVVGAVLPLYREA